MKLTVTPIVIGAHRTIPKVLEKRLEDFEIRERAETIKTTALDRLPRLTKKVFKICCHSASSEIP